MGFIEKISITCFLASYLVALALEISRLFFRSGVRGAVMLGFGIAGLIAHTLFLGHRALESATIDGARRRIRGPGSDPHDGISGRASLCGRVPCMSRPGWWKGIDGSEDVHVPSRDAAARGTPPHSRPRRGPVVSSLAAETPRRR